MAKAPAKPGSKATPKPPVNSGAATPPTATGAPATDTAPAADGAQGGSPGDDAAGGDLSTADAGQTNGSQGAGEDAGDLQTNAAPVASAAPRGRGPDTTKRPYVVGTVPIRHNGEFYGVGFDIELTTTEAERLDCMVVPLPEGKE